MVEVLAFNCSLSSASCVLSPYATSRLLGLAKIYVSEYEVASGREWTTESSYPLQDEQGGIIEVKSSYVCAYVVKP